MILKDNNIIITGAGRGIGREIAIRCANEGAQIALISRTEPELKETLNLIKNISPGSFYRVVDIKDYDSVCNAFSYILEAFKTVDCLVNNAGIQAPIGPFINNDITEWKNNIDVNLFGTVNWTYAVVKEMVKRKKGKIVNLSGGGSTSPRPNFSAYGVAKTAVVRFTETIAEELKEFNIDVNAIAPGAINTGMLDEVLKQKESAGKEYYEALKRKSVGGNDPQIAAELVSFLASSKSDGITGKLISAPWDPWMDEDFQNLLRTDKDLNCLRRIDNKYFIKK